MKTSRIVFLVFILSVIVLGTATAKPVRLGLEVGNPSTVLIIRPEPFDFKIGYSFSDFGQGSGSQGNFVHLSGDYRIVNSQPLIDFLSFFLGAGAYVQFHTESDADDSVVVGGRVPVGLQVYLLDGNVELFLELAPTVSFVPSLEAFGDWQGYLGFTIPFPGFK